MNIRIKALLYFKDGNILPHEVKQGEIITVTANQWEQIKQSGGKFEPLGMVPPPHTAAVEEPEPEAVLETETVDANVPNTPKKVVRKKVQ